MAKFKDKLKSIMLKFILFREKKNAPNFGKDQYIFATNSTQSMRKMNKYDGIQKSNKKTQ